MIVVLRSNDIWVCCFGNGKKKLHFEMQILLKIAQFIREINQDSHILNFLHSKNAKI